MHTATVPPVSSACNCRLFVGKLTMRHFNEQNYASSLGFDVRNCHILCCDTTFSSRMQIMTSDTTHIFLLLLARSNMQMLTRCFKMARQARKVCW